MYNIASTSQVITSKLQLIREPKVMQDIFLVTIELQFLGFNAYLAKILHSVLIPTNIAPLQDSRYQKFPIMIVILII